MTRNEAREIMMQILYELDATKVIQNDTSPRKSASKAKASAIVAERLSGGHIERGGRIINEIIENIDDIDASINSCSSRWKTTRMPKVDLAIMRLAAGEMRYCADIPEAVSINEAINLAKKFGTENSARFIHGVLGALTKAQESS